MENKRLSYLHNTADATLSPSLWEAYPVVPIESLACKTPLITTNVGAIPEITGHFRGRFKIITMKNDDAMKNAIDDVISGKINENQIDRENGKNYHDWNNIIKNTISVYDKLNEENIMVSTAPQVSIIVLNWNGWEDTIECLESIYRINYPSYNVLVVDNNSTDGSIEQIRNYAEGKIKVTSPFFDYNSNDKPIKIREYTQEESSKINKTHEENLSSNKEFTLIKNKKNYGFAEGNNIGIRYALNNFNPDYILLLNNDTVVDKDFLKDLVETGESDENIGMIGPKIYYYDAPQTIWCIGGKISWKFARGVHIGTNELDKGQYKEKRELDYVSGSAFLIKTEVLKKTGLMDKNFFLYFEETDLSLRASKLGYKSVYSPQAKIWHKVSKSGGGLSKPIGLYYITRNRWLFMKKWAKKSDYAFFIVYQAVGAIVFPVVLSVYYRNLGILRAYYSGLLNGIGN